MVQYELTDTEFTKLQGLVYSLTGISLSDHKRQLLRSRLQRRVRTLGLSSYEEYHDYVARLGPSSDETTEFINAITTNKTDFYRENHHFDFVAEHAVAEFLEAGINRLRIWHAGCSTGEEVYTLAIVLAKLKKQYPRLEYRQLATDIDTNVLQLAEEGIYSEERILPIAERTLSEYFLRSKGGDQPRYKVRPELQEFVTFRRLNLIESQWPLKSTSRFHLIFCRNVLIYFDKPTQNEIISGFRDRLEPDGYLFLGHSESIQGRQDELRNVGKTIFKAVGSLGRHAA